MTDLRDLLTNQEGVAIFPDPETSGQLRKIREFWNGTEEDGSETDPDLAALSDEEIEERLAAFGVTDTAMPAEVRDLVAAPGAFRRWKPGMAAAACLAAGIALAVLGMTVRQNTSATPSPGQIASSGSQEVGAPPLDPYLLLPSTPAPTGAMPDETGQTLRTVRLPGVGEDLDLNRAELRELQSLLNRFGYGPIPQLGLPSDDTDAAIADFRKEHDLAEGGADGIVLGILRELAHQAALQDLKDRSNRTLTPE